MSVLAGRARLGPGAPVAAVRGLQDLHQAAPEACQGRLAGDLVPHHALDVEDVHGAFAIGRNLGAVNQDVQPEQHLGELVQQAQAVPAVHFDHRVTGRDRVLDEHTRGDLEHVVAAGDRGPLRAQLLERADAPEQGALDGGLCPRQLVRVGEGAALGVAHPERVQRHAVARGVDARGVDARPGDGQRARDPAEQPRVVGGVDGHRGHGAIVVHPGVHGQGAPGGVGGAHQRVRRRGS